MTSPSSPSVPLDVQAITEEAARNLDVLRARVVERFGDEQQAPALISIIAAQLGRVFQTVATEDHPHHMIVDDINQVLDRMPGVRYRLRVDLRVVE